MADVRGPVRPRPLLVTALVLVTTVLAGCVQPVTVPPAPDAADPRCAEVMVALPRTLGSLDRLTSGTQAAAMWGDRADPVVLRCGVEPPGPTTEQCVQADDGEVSVDWIAVEGAEEAGADDPDASRTWTFTTYGRVPAVEVRVPASVTSATSTAFLVDLGPAVATLEQTRACL